MNFTQLQNDIFLTNLFSTIQYNRNLGLANRAMLERTTSIPMMPDLNQIAMNNFLATLNEALNSTGGSRPKLQRANSEPIGHSMSHLSRYKTELCRPFEEEGVCKYVDKCQFAHGVHELRTLQRHPKYKTELCRTFHSVGFCPYGARCHFIHSSQEALDHQTRLQESRKRASTNGSSSTSSLNQVTSNDKVAASESLNGFSSGSDIVSPTPSELKSAAVHDQCDPKFSLFNRINSVDMDLSE